MTVDKKNVMGSLDEMDLLFEKATNFSVRYFKPADKNPENFDIVIRCADDIADTVRKAKSIRTLLYVAGIPTHVNYGPSNVFMCTIMSECGQYEMAQFSVVSVLPMDDGEYDDMIKDAAIKAISEQGENVSMHMAEVEWETCCVWWSRIENSVTITNP